jgi:hypothetical protein
VIIYLGFNSTASFSLEIGLRVFRVVKVYSTLDFGPANGFHWQSDHRTIPMFKHVADRLVTASEEVETHPMYMLYYTRELWKDCYPLCSNLCSLDPQWLVHDLSLGVVSVREEAR